MNSLGRRHSPQPNMNFFWTIMLYQRVKLERKWEPGITQTSSSTRVPDYGNTTMLSEKNARRHILVGLYYLVGLKSNHHFILLAKNEMRIEAIIRETHSRHSMNENVQTTDLHFFIWTFCVLIFTDMKPKKNSIWFVSMFMKNQNLCVLVMMIMMIWYWFFVTSA